MGCIGREIIQSRTWIDPTETPIVNLNYKETFPITVFDAVRRSMSDDNSETLTKVLNDIQTALNGKQAIIPNKPANYLVTYGGVAGAVGAIALTRSIALDTQSHDKVPSEKAVFDLLTKIGVISSDGLISEGGINRKIRWTDIIDRPEIYHTLGANDDGFVVQKVLTEKFNQITQLIQDNTNTDNLRFKDLGGQISRHTADMNNPHNVTLSQLGAVSQSAFTAHLDEENPHHITPAMIGLSNVNNTSDADKPISKATQEALDAINTVLDTINGTSGQSFISLTYDESTGDLTATSQNGSELVINIKIDDLAEDITWDKSTKDLVITKKDGSVNRVSLAELFIRYVGSIESVITVQIEGDQSTGEQIIKAKINPASITDDLMDDESVITRVLADQAVTTDKIHDLTITTIKLADQSVTTEKIADLSITNDKLDNRSVNGRILFTSSIGNMILGVGTAGSDPKWMQIVSEMVANGEIKTINLADQSVTTDKLADRSVTNTKIAANAVATDQLADNAVTNEKVANGSIKGSKIVDNPVFNGVIHSTGRPLADSDSNEIPDTKWVRNFAKNGLTILSTNIADQAVTGEKLFTSTVRNRALVSREAGSTPVWGLINHEMIESDAVETENILDKAVTNQKLGDAVVDARTIRAKAVGTTHVDDNAITSEKIFQSNFANRVLGVTAANSNPVYTQVLRDMIADRAISSDKLDDGSVTLGKLEAASESYKVLATTLANRSPLWTRIVNRMMDDRSVDGRTLFSSSDDAVVLGVTGAGTNPAYMKVYGQMIKDSAIENRHLGEAIIGESNLQENIVGSVHIKDGSIESRHLAGAIVDPSNIISSEYPYRLLGVGSAPYEPPTWMQVYSQMIADRAVTADKLFTSDLANRVLGVTRQGGSPEYTMITNDFIVDGTIKSEKLVHNLVLYGTPYMTVPPSDDSDDYHVANTNWVRRIVAKMIHDTTPEIPDWYQEPEFEIPEHSIDGKKLFTHPEAPRVLGITEPNQDVEFILIGTDLIEKGAVTTDRIQRDVTLLGAPRTELRPEPEASDANGGGHQIPDCQWVLDRIAEKVISGGTGCPGCGAGGGTGTGTAVDFTVAAISDERITEIVDGISDSALDADSNQPAAFSLARSVSEDEETSEESTPVATSITTSNGVYPDECPCPHVPTMMTADYIKARVETIFGGDAITDLPGYEPTDIYSVYVDQSHNIVIISNGEVLSPDGYTVTDMSTLKLVYQAVDLPTATIDATNHLIINGIDLGDVDAIEALRSGDVYNIPEGSIVTSFLKDRSVTGAKLFTSSVDNRILAVTTANSDPIWTQIVTDMVKDRAITGEKIFTSNEPCKVLAVQLAGGTPEWTEIIGEMIAENGVYTKNLNDKAVTTEKIADFAVGAQQLADEPIISEKRLMTDAVTNDKIKDNSVTGDKLVDGSVTSEKLADEIAVKPASLEKAVVRNIIISSQEPSNDIGSDGDIWIRYV